LLCILEERFSNYRKAISCKVRKGGTNQKKTGFAFLRRHEFHRNCQWQFRLAQISGEK